MCSIPCALHRNKVYNQFFIDWDLPRVFLAIISSWSVSLSKIRILLEKFGNEWPMLYLGSRTRTVQYLDMIECNTLVVVESYVFSRFRLIAAISFQKGSSILSKPLLYYHQRHWNSLLSESGCDCVTTWWNVTTLKTELFTFIYAFLELCARKTFWNTFMRYY